MKDIKVSTIYSGIKKTQNNEDDLLLIELKKKSAIEWEGELTAIGVPAGVVMTVPEILAHPHIAHRGLLAVFEHVQGLQKPITVVRTGFQSDGQPASVDTPPPVIGEHNDEILGELGYDGEAIEKLRQEGVI